MFDCGSDDTTCNAFDLFIFYGVSGTVRQSGKCAAEKSVQIGWPKNQENHSGVGKYSAKSIVIEVTAV